MKGLYAIVDAELCARRGLDAVAFADAVIEGGASVVQLRAKKLDGRAVLGLLRELAPLCARRGVALYANDRADVAWLAATDGLHVGQTDLPPIEVRALFERAGRKVRLGLSTHDEAQAEAAVTQPIDYLAIGPVFGTTSKEQPDATVGLERTHAIARLVRSRRPSLPVVAIGGIGPAEARRLAGHVDMIAVIGALLPREGERVDDASERARALLDAFGGADVLRAPR